MSTAWLIAAATIAVTLPLAAIATRHALWLHGRRRATRIDWWHR